MAEADVVALNPFENTFSLLQGLQQEVHDLKAALAQEKEDRINDVNALKAHLEELKATQSEKTEAVVDDSGCTISAKLESIEANFEELRSSRLSAHEKLEDEFKQEEEERKSACTAITKKLGQEAAQWRSRCEKIDRTMADNKKMGDGLSAKLKERLDELAADVAKHNATLTNNRMALDPFKHFSCMNREGASLRNDGADNDAIKLPKVE
mmetsp:Transcript_114369/g.180028  ORF Transcript_114369/g.180028 Transcript_114369/m.180028 type:complete len:210 (-) Transcript_114369:87-716(-)